MTDKNGKLNFSDLSYTTVSLSTCRSRSSFIHTRFVTCAINPSSPSHAVRCTLYGYVSLGVLRPPPSPRCGEKTNINEPSILLNWKFNVSPQYFWTSGNASTNAIRDIRLAIRALCMCIDHFLTLVIAFGVRFIVVNVHRGFGNRHHLCHWYNYTAHDHFCFLSSVSSTKGICNLFFIRK